MWQPCDAGDTADQRGYEHEDQRDNKKSSAKKSSAKKSGAKKSGAMNRSAMERSAKKTCCEARHAVQKWPRRCQSTTSGSTPCP